jgi:hypothetical protein
MRLFAKDKKMSINFKRNKAILRNFVIYSYICISIKPKSCANKGCNVFIITEKRGFWACE